MQVVYVTVDPERDDVARMHELPGGVRPELRRRHRHRRRSWRRCASDYGIAADKTWRRPTATLIAHSSFVYLIDREGKLRALMPYGHDADDFVHDVKLLLRALSAAAMPSAAAA